MTTQELEQRLVVIEWCYDCPHNDHSACSAKNVKCGLTKKRISGINCTPFPKTCPLPRPAPAPQFTPYIPGKGKQNTYRCCEVCPNVPCKPLFRVNCTRQDPVSIAAQAREEAMIAENKRVLDAVAGLIMEKTGLYHPAHFDPDCSDIPSLGVDELAQIIKSLRGARR